MSKINHQEINKLNQQMTKYNQLSYQLGVTQGLWIKLFPDDKTIEDAINKVKQEIEQITEKKKSLASEMPRGVILDVEKFVKDVLDVWDSKKVTYAVFNTKSVLEETEYNNALESLKDKVEIINDETGQNFNVDECVYIEFYRPTNERNILFFVGVCLAPGYGFALLGTDKVTWSVGTLNNKKFVGQLLAEVGDCE